MKINKSTDVEFNLILGGLFFLICNFQQIFSLDFQKP